MTRPHARLPALLVSGALALPLAGLALVGACQNRAQTASEHLRDAVVGYNDALRFGRMDLASERVALAFRANFAGTHYRWGRAIDITDYEIVNVQTSGEELEEAVSFVTYGWVVRGTVYVKETLVRQAWTKEGGEYYLVDERVVDGDADLLTVPEGFRPEESAFGNESPDAGVPAP